MTDLLLVLAGALVGAPVRYLLGIDAKYRLGGSFPWGTLAANAAACLVLGFVAQGATDGELGSRLQLLLATGFCGALSTWSTFSYELLTLASARRLAVAGDIWCSASVRGSGSRSPGPRWRTRFCELPGPCFRRPGPEGHEPRARGVDAS